MAERPMVRCDDCEGTGAEEHDCWLCKGSRFVTVEKAMAEGFSESDLDDVDDGEAHCPSCHGETCEACEGSGEVDAELPAQEEDRVLICAMQGGHRIPPLFFPNSHGGVWRDDDRLLSPSAAARLSERRHLFHLRVLAFGDSISLLGDGHAEAKLAWRRHRERWKLWIAGERQRRADRKAALAAREAANG